MTDRQDAAQAEQRAQTLRDEGLTEEELQARIQAAAEAIKIEYSQALARLGDE